MEFKYYTNEINEVSSLIKEAFDIELDNNSFFLLDNQRILLLKDNDKVVGMVLITLKSDPFKNKRTYYLDYLCVRNEYQHRALGRKIFERVIELAKEKNINRIELTSRKERISARKIYLDYGMKIRDTDLFELEL